MKTRLPTMPTLLLILAAPLLIGLGMPAGSPSAGENKKAPPKHVSVDLGGGVVVRLVRIPPGKFKMGSPTSEQEYVRKHSGDAAGARAKIETLHEVEITKPFYMGAYEVTQAEYEKVLGKNPSAYSPVGKNKDAVAGQDTSRFPVENVTWDDAMAFCRALTKRFKKTFDLPTEAEWEYACRAGTTTAFCYGNSFSARDANIGSGWYGEAKKASVLSRPARVGSYKANAFGLYDMHGNVYEWCKDWYERNYYARSPARDPQGPEKGDDGYRVLRGGTFASGPAECRSAFHYGQIPTRCDAFIGFRVVARVP